MSDIVEGDTVTRGMSTWLWYVEAVRGDNAWLSRSAGGANILVPLATLTKVPPRFVAGKRYRAVSNYEITVDVISVNDIGAVGWFVASSKPWARFHANRPDWTEIGNTPVTADVVVM